MKREFQKEKSEKFMRWLCLWAASFCFVFLARAQVKPEVDFEITAHRARLQIFPSSNAISCTDTLTIHNVSGKKKQFTFRLLSVFEIENVLISGKPVEFHRDRRFRDSVVVENIPADKEFSLIIAYSGELAFRSELSRLTSERAILRDVEILPWTNTELQFIRFNIIVPKEWEAITAGRLVAQSISNEFASFVWELAQPIPMIGWICAGKYIKRTSANAVPISTYLFSDSSVTHNNEDSMSSSLSGLASSILNYYSQKFSLYRFSQLSIIEVDDWVAGRNVLAVACPSFVMVKKLAFTTQDKFNQAHSILAHEIAHQWWPVTVFLDDDADAALLSEGMCEYSARLYNEANNSMTLRDSLKRHPLLRPLIMRVKKGNDIPLHQKADLRSVTTQYLKASYVHNMLRRVVGDSVLFRLFREYAKRFSLKRAELSDFKLLAEELSGKKLGWFFDQWVERKAIPQLKIYNVKTSKQNNAWRTQGRVRIVGYDKFTTPVSVGVETAKGETTTSVWLGEDSSGLYHNDAAFEIMTNEKPFRATLDPDGDILKMQKLPAKLSDLRDPSDGIMIIGTLKHSEYLLTLARKDSAVMHEGGWSIRILSDTSATLGDLQQDRIFLYGNASENRVANNLQEKFPLKFSGDSIHVGKETIFDSTLAMIQSIENPYSSHGMMCWIAPLSERAKPELIPFDASWILVKGKEEISSGIWETDDKDLYVEIQR